MWLLDIIALLCVFIRHTILIESESGERLHAVYRRIQCAFVTIREVDMPKTHSGSFRFPAIQVNVLECSLLSIHMVITGFRAVVCRRIYNAAGCLEDKISPTGPEGPRLRVISF